MLVTSRQSEDGGIGGEALERLTQPDLGLTFVVGGESGANSAFKVACGCVLHGNGFEESQCFPSAAYTRESASHGFAHGEVVGKGLSCRFENVHGALRVAVVECSGGAAHAPVSPDGLHGLALSEAKIGAAADAHQGCVERAVIANVVEQPDILDLDGGRRLFFGLGVVSLHAIHVLLGVSDVASGGVEAGLGFEEVDVAVELLAHGRGNLRDFLERFLIAMRGRERGDEAFPCVGAIGVVREHLAVERVGLIGVVADEIDGCQLKLQRDAGLAAGRNLKF